MSEQKHESETVEVIARFEMEASSCECCGTSIEAVPDKRGEWVRWEDVQAIIAKATNQ